MKEEVVAVTQVDVARVERTGTADAVLIDQRNVYVRRRRVQAAPVAVIQVDIASGDFPVVLQIQRELLHLAYAALYLGGISIGQKLRTLPSCEIGRASCRERV